MYIAFVALYLLTCVNFEELNRELEFKPIKIEDKYKPIYANYTDLSNNAIHSFNYCGLKTCLIKCCADGQYLDDDGECQEEQYFSDELKSRYGFGIEYWNEVRRGVRDHEKQLSEDFVFILRAGNLTTPERNFTSDNAFVLFGGELYYILEDPIRVIEVWRLHYCADHQIQLKNTDRRVKFVYDISDVHEILPESDDDQKNKVHIEYYVLGGGLLFTTLSIAIIICRVPNLMKRGLMLYNLLAYLFSLICAYGLKIMHMALSNTGILHDDGCKVVSSVLYTLLLSAFCWTLLINYDSFKTLRTFRLTKKIMIESDIRVFFGYAMFAWGLPSVMTLIALAGDKYDIGFLPAPFDSCFKNGNETMAYLHIPVSLLIIAQTTIFLVYAYDMWIVNMIIDRSKQKGPRTFVFGKLVSLLLLFILIINTPNIPVLLFYIECISIIVIWITYLFIFVCNIMLMCRRSSKTNGEKYQALKEKKSSTYRNNDKISIISNNELDKKKTLNFSHNISMVKDHVMASIMPHDYEKLLNELLIDSNADAHNNDAEKNIGMDGNLQNNDNFTSNKQKTENV